jgi:MFS family permease
LCIEIGLLFLARGAFLPYDFPLFEHLGAHSYSRIALLLNVYIFAQSICAPAAGWFTDKTSVRIALATSIALGLSSFLLFATKPEFMLCAAVIFATGLAFVLGKIALNTLLVLHSSEDILRRSVAKRATLVNLGSFVGNSIAFHMTTRVGYRPLAILLGPLHPPLAIGLAASAAPASTECKTSQGAATLGTLLKNRGFLGD